MEKDLELDDEEYPEAWDEAVAQAEQTFAASQAQAQPSTKRGNPTGHQPPTKRVRYNHDQQDTIGSSRSRAIGRGSENRSESFGVGNASSFLEEEEEESINNRNQIIYDEESKGYVNKAINNNRNDSNNDEGSTTTNGERNRNVGGTESRPAATTSNGRTRALPPPNGTVIRKDGKLAHPLPKKGKDGEKGFLSDEADDDNWWKQADLLNMEEEAVRNSQQQKSQSTINNQDSNNHFSNQNHVKGNINRNFQSRTASPSLVHRPQPLKNQNPQQQRNLDGNSNSSPNHQNNNRINAGNRSLQKRSNSGSSVGNASGLRNYKEIATGREEDEKDRELRQMREEVEKLRAAHQEQLVTLQKVKESQYASAGEVSIVRSRHDKLQLELSSLRQKEIAREKQYKDDMEKLRKENEMERSNLRVQGAFERHVNDTQGAANFRRSTAWPGSNLASGAVPQSVRRAGPSLSGSRMSSQMGLRTPVSKPGSGVNPESFYSRGSSGGKKRKAEGDGINNSPSNDRRDGAALVSPSKGRNDPKIASAEKKKKPQVKGPAFPGFENSFAAPSPHSKNKDNKFKKSNESKGKSALLAEVNQDQGEDVEMDLDPVAETSKDLDEVLDPGMANARENEDEGEAFNQLDFDAVPPLQSQDQVPPPLLSARSTWEDPHRWYLYAVTELQRRRSAFVAQILAHTTSPHSPPRTLPGSRYLPRPPTVKAGKEWSLSLSEVDHRREFDVATSTLPQPVFETQRASNVSNPSISSISSSNTLSRILALQLPSSCPTVLHVRLASCKTDLLNLLSKGSTSDGVERFKFLLVRAEAFIEDTKPSGILSKEKEVDRKRVKDETFWETDEEVCRGVLELSEGLAVVARILLGLLLRVGLIDAFNDVMSLTSSIAIAEPSFATCLLIPDVELPGLSSLSTQARNPGREMTMAGTFALETTSNPKILKTPTEICDILVEALRRCCLVPLGISSPESIGPEPPWNSDAWKDWEKWEKTKPCDIGESSREQLMEYWVDLIETFCWREGGGNPEDLKPIYPIFDSPGILLILLDSKRSASFLQRVIRLLTELTRYNTWKSLLQKNLDDKLLPNLHPMARKSQVPLFEVLARHLVDRVADTSPLEAHQLHTNIVVFLAQLVSKQPDALQMAANSESILAALVKCLSLDTDTIWNFDGRGINERETRLEEILSRIDLDVKLLYLLFVEPSCLVSLTDRLDSPQMGKILNGARHLFILSVGRAAFAAAPDWLSERYDEGMGRKLESVSYPASELLNVVLSPEESDDLYSLLASVEEVEDEDEEDDEEEEMIAARSAEDHRILEGLKKGDDEEDSSTEDEDSMN